MLRHAFHIRCRTVRSHVCAHSFRDLHTHCSTSAAAAENKNTGALANLALVQRLQRSQGNSWQGSRFLERNPRGLLGHLLGVSAHKFSKSTRVVPEHLVPDFQGCHISSDSRNHPSKVKTDRLSLQTPSNDGNAWQLVVDRVDGGGPDLHQHLASAGSGPRQRGLGDAVAGRLLVHYGFHRVVARSCSAKARGFEPTSGRHSGTDTQDTKCPLAHARFSRRHLRMPTQHMNVG
mmetsp:Transcript_128477/g.411828  ORF Transcript_128477/g.411828 Transcript_128477/m.411828 type:complete len:233 (+) Transcript_128477:436-1134(+)